MSTSVATTSAARPRARPTALLGGHVLASSRCSCGAAKSSVETSCDSCGGLMLQPQRMAGGGGAATVSPDTSAPGSVANVLRTSGHALDASSRRYFGPRFGHDFSEVRIHTGPMAEASARAIHARAYTADHHVVFGRGEYRPGSSRTQRLLAHELTHVVQQRAGRKSDAIEPPGSAAEREADGNERRLAAGEAPLVRERATGISRTCAARGAGEHMTGEESTAADCGERKQRVLERAFNMAGDWICQTTDKLQDLMGGPEDEANAGTRESFQRHFHTTDAAAVTQVHGILSSLGNDMGRGRYRVDCGAETDEDFESWSAHVPRTGGDQIVFCPRFFNRWTDRGRAGIVVHEVAHTSGVLRIRDRAYQYDRQLPFLTTAEALRNAESYELLVEELVTGRRVRGTAPRDEIEDCSEEVEPLVRRALALAQRWNDRSFARDETDSFGRTDFEAHLGDSTRAARRRAKDVFRKGDSRFDRAFEVRCESEPEAECSSQSAYGEAGSDHVVRGGALGVGSGGARGRGLGLAAGSAAAATMGAGMGVLAGLSAGMFLLGVGGLLGLGIGALTSSRNTIHICPDWADERPNDRAESILAAVYAMEEGRSVEDSQRYAALARALHDRDIADVN